ncbi:triokinase/FMN cyclase-like [Littorina saxatilis]|uniref:Triokinase/FMN cyclase n=1 Tax=Littorina saxatilis TaxID=31220 RepID=A0AAN9BDA6_9CAEN
MSGVTKSKKLVNSVERCVDECLAGLVATNPGLQLLEGHRVVVRADVASLVNAGTVTIMSGGGSGHEPAHAGYIGEGMLSGAVAGAVFTSPPPGSILAAIRAIGTNNKGGVVAVVKNYTGDRLNFGLAVERAKAEGIKADMVVVGEDCALTSADKTAGRRGLCGTVLIHKIAGALALKGCPLEEVVKIAKDATTKMGTVGLSLTPCSLPGAGPSFQLAADEMELGLGIHGEAGVKRMKLQSAKDAVKTVLDHMTNPKTSTHLTLPKGESVALMVNNLGGTSVLELNIVAHEAVTYLESMGVSVDRMYCGIFMTSLEMAGISLTVLRLDDTLKACLDAPTSAPGWQHPLLAAGITDRRTPKVMKVTDTGRQQSSDVDTPKGSTLSQGDADRLFSALQAIGQSLLAAEERLNSLDLQSGDGDCGSTMARGAKDLVEQLGKRDSPGLPVSCPSECAVALSAIAENIMGGSSGALYSLFLTAAAVPLRSGVGASDWAKALQAGITAVMRYGGAEPGHRTMLDPLHAAATTFSKQLSAAKPVEAFTAAVKAAETAAEATTKMAAQAGRASYVSANLLTQPDPGAVAVVIWMKAVLEKLA